MGSQNVLCWSVYWRVFKSRAEYRYSLASAGRNGKLQSGIFLLHVCMASVHPVTPNTGFASSVKVLESLEF